MKAIKVAIAGLGRSGWNMHAMALEQLPQYYLISAVTDADEQRLHEARERFGCETFSTFTELLASDAELITIASPSPFHAEQSIAALKAGKHVNVEKPMARNAQEAEAMIAAAKSAGRILTVNQNYRYRSYFRKMTEVMASGKLGSIIQIRIAIQHFSRRWDWQTLKANNGGILTNHGAHVLDWLLGHFQDEDPEVFCHMLNTSHYAGDADSHSKIIIRPKDGPLLDVELSHANAYPQDSYSILGSLGSLSGSNKQLRWKYYDPSREKTLELDPNPSSDRSYNSENLHFTEESIVFSERPNEDMLLLYTELYGTLRENKTLAISPESVKRQMKLMDACRRSAGWA